MRRLFSCLVQKALNAYRRCIGANYVECSSGDASDLPLEAGIVDGALVISIGVQELRRMFDNDTSSLWLDTEGRPTVRIAAPMTFAASVVDTMTHCDEEETSEGGSWLEAFLIEMMDQAIQEGANGVIHEDDVKGREALARSVGFFQP